MTVCMKCFEEACDDSLWYDWILLQCQLDQTFCTPEEKAGTLAGLCFNCGRFAVHQYTKECMACGVTESGGEE